MTCNIQKIKKTKIISFQTKSAANSVREGSLFPSR